MPTTTPSSSALQISRATNALLHKQQQQQEAILQACNPTATSTCLSVQQQALPSRLQTIGNFLMDAVRQK
jgi:hypothetical protein